MTKIPIPTLVDIENAYSLIKPYIHKTPVTQSELLNGMLGCKVHFKCENFQKSGAFKYRGAMHSILKLSDAEKLNGVSTHSSGNHAGALAKASLMHGLKAYIVMPNNAPRVKIDAVRSYNGKIAFCEPTLKAREEMLEQVQDETGATLIHPYDNFNVICGQGTSCFELVSQIDEPDIVMMPVGGGGLMSGTSIVAKSLWKNTLVYAAEPKNADDAYRSFKSKERMPSVSPKTMADGLLSALSERTFTIMLENVDDVLVVKEQSIMKAMKLVFQYLKIVIEPSSAVPLAAVIDYPDVFNNKKVAIILSGGNVDLPNLPF